MSYPCRKRKSMHYARALSLGALLVGCNSILGIDGDYHLVSEDECSAPSSCAGMDGVGAGGSAAGARVGGSGGVSGADTRPGDGGTADSGPTSGGAPGGEGGSPSTGGDSEGGGGTAEAGAGAGDAGSGGSVVPGNVGEVGEPCAPADARACVGHAGDERLLCEDGSWASNGTCETGSLCDTSDAQAGACSPVVEECVGESAGFTFCRNREQYECGVDLVTARLVKTCAAACVAGECAGECVPETTDCDGGGDSGNGLVPRTCQSDGTWLDDEPCMYLCRVGACVAATCGDGDRNGDETDEDCGGSCGATCEIGESCAGDGDCVLPGSGNCANGQCVAATCDDDVKNGSETDEDCGGSCSVRCVGGQACGTNSDCADTACVSQICSGVCSPGNRICSNNGVATCGSTGVYSSPAQCTDQTCISGTCQGICAPNQTDCDGPIPQTCNATGGWTPGSVTAGQCGAECTPSTTQCSGLTRQQTCSASGTWSSPVDCTNQTCVGTGVGSACQGVCAQGQTQCPSSSAGVQNCTTTGTWSTPVACNTPQICQSGACVCPSGTPNACNNDCTNFQTDRFNCGSCGHSCQGGQCSAGVCQPFTLFTHGATPVNIAVSSSGVYYTDSASGGFVYSTPLNGGSSSVASTFGGDCGVMGLYLDATNIYGITRAGNCQGLAAGTLRRAPLPGGSATTVSSSLGATFPTQAWRCMTGDATNLYYTNYEPQNVYRVPKAGGSATALASNLPGAPKGITVQGSSLYWAATFGTLGVMQMATSGGTITRLTTSVTGAFIAADATHVYYVNSGSLMKLPAAGGSAVTLATNATGPLVLDTNNVFFASSSSVMMIAKTGGTATTLAPSTFAPVDIAVDATGVYWISGSVLMKVAR